MKMLVGKYFDILEIFLENVELEADGLNLQFKESYILSAYKSLGLVLSFY